MESLLRVSLILVLATGTAACNKKPPKGELVVMEPDGFTHPLVIIDRAEDRRTLSPALSELTGQTNIDVRSRLAQAVGRIGDPRGSPILLKLIFDPEPRVRHAAYFASGPSVGICVGPSHQEDACEGPFSSHARPCETSGTGLLYIEAVRARPFRASSRSNGMLWRARAFSRFGTGGWTR